jgi:hypothetical protein
MREPDRAEGASVTVPTSPGGYLAPADVADLLKIGVRAACNVMRKAGGFQLGGSWRIRLDLLDAWLARKAADEQAATSIGRALRRAPRPLASALLPQPGTEFKPLRHPQPRKRKATP